MGVLQIVHSYFCLRKLYLSSPSLFLLIKAFFAERVTAVSSDRLIEYFEAYDAHELRLHFLSSFHYLIYEMRR